MSKRAADHAAASEADTSSGASAYSEGIRAARTTRRKTAAVDVAARTPDVDDLQRAIAEDPEGYLRNLCARWGLDDVNASLDSVTRRALVNFGVDCRDDIDVSATGTYGMDKLLEEIEKHQMECTAMFYVLRRRDPHDEKPELRQRALAVMTAVFHAKNIAINSLRARIAAHGLHNPAVALSEDLDREFSLLGTKFGFGHDRDVSPLQKLMMHCLDHAQACGYRKRGDFVYEQITVGGHNTHAWRQVMKIEDLVQKVTSKERNFEMWGLRLSYTQSTKLLAEDNHDFQFPRIVKDRTVFAFRNGVYRAREDKFSRFGADPPLPDTVVSAKFFDADFDVRAYEDCRGAAWRDIPTPHLQRIMDYQEWPPDVCDWMLVMLGRLVYELNQDGLDKWQVIPFLLGAAQSGKSTICQHVASQLYDPEDVGTMSNNIERQFGLGALVDKLVVVAPEIGAGWKIDQTEFQSLVSGEPLSTAIKHGAPVMATWKIPGIMAGNEVPAFSDNSGSVQRRFVVFAFEKAVLEADGNLPTKLRGEMPALLLKANRAYLEAAGEWGGRSLWTVLPQYFRDTRKELSQTVNSIEAFLANPGYATVGPGLHCSLADFRARWAAFCKENNYDAKRFSKELYRNVFHSRGVVTATWRVWLEQHVKLEPVQVEEALRAQTYRDKPVKPADTFVFGAGLVQPTDAGVVAL
jgi:hypothetical protein